MATHTTLSSLFTAIADALRAKKGTTATIVADNFPTEIGNLPGYTYLGSTDLAVNSDATSAASAGTLALGSDAYTADKILYVRVRDKAGPRAGYFYGSDTFILNTNKANSSTTAQNTIGRIIHRYTTSNQWAVYVGATTTGYGVYAYSITSGGTLNIYRRYSSSYSLTINGTYRVEAYLIDFPDGKSPYSTGAIT